MPTEYILITIMNISITFTIQMHNLTQNIFTLMYLIHVQQVDHPVFY